MLKRRYLVTAAVAVALSMVGTTLPKAASAATAVTPAEEAFRANIGTYLQNLRGALEATANNPSTSAGVAAKLADYRASLTFANQQLAAMSAEELDAMQNLTGGPALWAQRPLGLVQQLSGVRQLAPVTPPVGFLSNCQGSLGDLRGLFDSYWIAAQVASAASAVAAGFPSSLTFLPGLIIVAIIFGVANGLAISFAKDLSLSQDCAAAVANATLATAYPIDTVTGLPTPASSQISVNTLTAAAAGIKDTLDDIQIRTNAITGKLTQLITDLGTAQGTANTILVTVKDLQDRSDALLVAIGAPTDLTTATANGLANNLNNRLDTILANTATFQALSVRAEIESMLADRSQPPVAIFVLPASQGGYIEIVRDTVATTIQNELSAGQSVGTAQTNLAQGNAALAAQNYQSAYLSYNAAYLQAVN